MPNSLELMNKRLEWQGGNQEQRMIKDKFRTFQRALMFSYQGCDVQMAQKRERCKQLENMPQYRALINPDKLKQDYDNKILSIDYSTHFSPGDVFLWIGTDSHWIIYLEQLTEDAYFRGEIRLCRYKIKFKDEQGETVETWAAIRGPVETQIDSIQKNQVRIDRPNESLNILMPQNEQTLAAFQRYSEFLFKGKCWRVQATDSVSIKGTLEINAEEYYIDRDTDDTLEELKNGLVIEPVDPSPNSVIKGETFIKPMIKERYFVDLEGGTWSVLEDYPVCIKKVDEKTVEVMWRKSVSGQFTLQWSNGGYTYKKVIVVESLF